MLDFLVEELRFRLTMKTRTVSNTVGYDSWASFYDEYPNPTLASDEIHFPVVWSHLHHKQVLEIGCGTGRHTEKLIALGNEVVGIDVSAGMLAIARNKLRGKEFELIQADFMTYNGFPQNSFDAVVCSLVIEHIASLGSFFLKLSRIVKGGGDFFLSEIHPQRAAGGSLAHFKDEHTQEEVYLNSHVHTDEAMCNAAEKVGFEIERNEDVLGNSALAALRPEWKRYDGIPMIKIWVFRKKE